MLSSQAFDAAVDAALAEIPDDLWAEVDNVDISVEDEAPGEPHLYGRYHGVPLTDRSVFATTGAPDGIVIYRAPLLRDHGHDRAQLQRQIRITVLHEVGHYFGLDERRLAELGYG
jgi:predicted Zn-dependent protease with MMP-like domain